MTVTELKRTLDELDGDMPVYFLGIDGVPLKLTECWVGAHQRRGLFFELEALGRKASEAK